MVQAPGAARRQTMRERPHARIWRQNAGTNRLACDVGGADSFAYNLPVQSRFSYFCLLH